MAIKFALGSIFVNAFGLLFGVSLIIGQSTLPSSATNAAGIQFVRVAPGWFVMGCFSFQPDCLAPEQGARRVQITRPFEIGRYEVTQAQWETVMGSNPSHFRGADLPVEQVDWNDVQKFFEKLNATNDGYRYRLPTEAEWEYAARAGYSGKPPGGLDSVAWINSNSEKTTHPVGQKQPNGWGLYDMLGNVSEWVQDRFSLDYYRSAPAVDPPGPNTGPNRVLRGGSWAEPSDHSRAAYRVQMAPTFKNGTMGFRCVREPRQ